MADAGDRRPGGRSAWPSGWFRSLSGSSQAAVAAVLITTVGGIVVAAIGVAPRAGPASETNQRSASAEVNVTVTVPTPPIRVASTEKTPEPTPIPTRAATFTPELVLSYPDGSPCAVTIQIGAVLPREQWPPDIEQGTADVNSPIIPANVHLGRYLRGHPRLTASDLKQIPDDYFDLLGPTWDARQAAPCLALLGLTPMIASRFGGDPDSTTLDVPVACVARPPGTSHSYWVTTNREQIGNVISADGSTFRFKDFRNQSYLLERVPGAPYGWIVTGWVPQPIPGCAPSRDHP
ncbi:MAG: hypothetical protein KGJ98_12110 [Chloroflexota bacterium]|nr:hypothetical protein [Chloroflexota bacterium]